MKIALLASSSFAALCAALPLHGAVDYEHSVKPLLRERCYACHGALKQKGGLRLDTAEAMRKGGDSGPALLPKEAAKSPLIERLLSKDPDEQMPPKHEGEPFSESQIRLLQNWIAQGAPAPANERPEADPREHWAFQPRTRPAIPPLSARAARWARNPIDAFVAQAHEKAGLTPQPEAPSAVLLRRLFLDLLGVPPSAEELAAVAQAPDSSWVEPTVDRLLNDPRYGERWGRHWMDIWRYSDAWILQGYTVARDSQKHLWHWRDWIIESLNADLPYDEMIRQMVAADELYPDDLSKLRATGFLARNFNIFNRLVWMDSTVEHLGKGFLGLTFNCAKCHDHKYDPIRQEDYYRMRSFFEPYHVRLDVAPGQADLDEDGIPRVFDAEPNAPTYLFPRGDETRPDKSRVIPPGVPEVLAFDSLAVQPVSLPKTETDPARRPWVLEAHVQTSRQRLRSAEEALAKVDQKLEASSQTNRPAQSDSSPNLPPATPSAEELAILERDAAEKALHLAQAEFQSTQSKAEAMRAAWEGVPEKVSSTAKAAAQSERDAAVARAKHKIADLVWNLAKTAPDKRKPTEGKLSAARTELAKAAKAAGESSEKFEPLPGAKWSATQFGKVYQEDRFPGFPSTSTGRRLALARWLTDSRNPLPARVAVNHIWLRHMGKPLVNTVFDFGRKGAAPTHPELLDWLASELVEGAPKGAPWAMKHLHRLIVTSATYRMTSSMAGAETSEKIDPDNRLLWRRHSIRMEAEAVRDCVLSVAGTLEPRIGGPSVPAQGREQSTRRSLYFTQNWVDRSLFLATFDGPDSTVCYRRDQSIVPQQALALSNAAMVQDAARTIVSRLTKEAPAELADPAFLDRAFLSVLNRLPDDVERRLCLDSLQAFRALPKPAPVPASPDVARVQIVAALLNHADFVTIR
jgi:hypothetical protein